MSRYRSRPLDRPRFFVPSAPVGSGMPASSMWVKRIEKWGGLTIAIGIVLFLVFK